MKFWVKAIAILFIPLNMKAASTSGAPLEELKNYSAIIGAWEMNKKCDKLNPRMKEDFRLSLLAIQKNFKERGVSDKKMRQLTKDSIKVARVEPYASCGGKAIQAIAVSYKLAISRANEIVAELEAKESE